jgi:GNAT superfamily N-acetyltransferase
MREILRSYFQINSPEEHRRAEDIDMPVRLERADRCPNSFYRYLYVEVGRGFHWVDRLPWTDEQITDHLNDKSVSLWVLYSSGVPAGYFELKKHPDGSAEIAYFGLLPEFHGRGLGKWLLSQAIDRAWETGANRIWLHTCTLDHPAAIPNYVARGFRLFKQETYMIDGPGGSDDNGLVHDYV